MHGRWLEGEFGVCQDAMKDGSVTVIFVQGEKANAT